MTRVRYRLGAKELEHEAEERVADVDAAAVIVIERVKAGCFDATEKLKCQVVQRIVDVQDAAAVGVATEKGLGLAERTRPAKHRNGKGGKSLANEITYKETFHPARL